MVATTPSGYSANVKLELEVGGQRIPLAQVGGGELMFYQETVLPGSRGIAVAYIDAHVSRWEVEWEPSAAGRKRVKATYRLMGEGEGAEGVVEQAAGHGA